MFDGSLPASASRLRGLRALIVEDSWHIANALESLLEQVGMIIVGGAASANDAERLAHELAPKLAVVDIKLRDGMAHALIDRLHDLVIRVVVVTAFDALVMPLVKTAAILRKPFNEDELLTALVRAI
jgi:DNA-binding response OmpR family regulator